MRDPRELLALLTAQVQRFAAAPGGIPVLTHEEVAGALAMIHNPSARLYARVKYCGQHAFAEELAMAMMEQTRSLAPRHASHAVWHDLCRMALAEAVDPHTCWVCHGRRDAMIGHRLVRCTCCRGQGVRPPRDADRYRLMGISKPRWFGCWKPLYRRLQINTVDTYEAAISAVVGRKAG